MRVIEEHIRENEVMEGSEVAPCLKSSYLAYNNSIRLDLQALGLESRTAERALAPFEIMEIEAKKGASEAPA